MSADETNVVVAHHGNGRGARADAVNARQFDVSVVGAGMIGLACACLFARRGLRVALIEARDLNLHKDLHKKNDARVSAINIASENIFRELNVWDILAPDAHAYREMKVWDCNSAAEISFHAADLGKPCLGHIIENRALTSALLENFRQYDNAEIFDNARLGGIERIGDGLRLALPQTNIETRLLAAADGANSRARELAGIETRHIDSGEDAVIATLSVARGHQNTAWQCFCDDGTLAMLPLADDECALVWSCARAHADALMQLAPEEFCARVQPWFEKQLGEIANCRGRGRFALNRHHAGDYIADSLALVGDAAHCIHPLAGLGANLGLLDAAALFEAATETRNPGKRGVLRRYQRRRRGENEIILRALEMLNDMFASRNTFVTAARSAGMNMTDALAPLKNLLAKLACGMQGDLPNICRRAPE